MFFVVTGALVFETSPARFILIPIVAAVLFRNFSLMHEAVHRTASKSKWLNEFIGIAAGAVCLLPFDPWRRSHLEHHTWSGNLDKDPVTGIITAFPKFSSRTQGLLSLLWHTWIPVMALSQYFLFWLLAIRTCVRSKISVKLWVNLVAPALLWGSLFSFVSPLLSFGVLLPAVLVYLVAVEAVNFPHHLQLPQYRGDTRLATWDQHMVSRTCVYPKWFSRWVTLNFNYHTEHHMFPDAPWYQLEKLHHELKAALADDLNLDHNLTWIIEHKKKPLIEVMNYRPAIQNVKKAS